MAQENVGKRFEGYQIYDRHYEKVGKVDDLFVDENDVPEYIGVKTGLFGGPSTLIPMDIVRVNDLRQLVEVASDKDTIEEGPSFGDDAEITAEFEERVYAHFGATREPPPAGQGRIRRLPRRKRRRGRGIRGALPGARIRQHGAGNPRGVRVPVGAPQTRNAVTQRPRPRSGAGCGAARGRTRLRLGHRDGAPGADGDHSGAGTTDSTSAGTVGSGMSMGDTETGEFREHDRNQEGLSQPGSDLEDEDELRVQRSEEELLAGTREREAGSVNVRKRVRTDREQVGGADPSRGGQRRAGAGKRRGYRRPR